MVQDRDMIILMLGDWIESLNSYRKKFMIKFPLNGNVMDHFS